uniref:DUF3444 domain-containing protein n=1 Tax=Heterorhabditis bacteriophora TaxID=37862 RepID=A0A1I7XEX2_HETBA
MPLENKPPVGMGEVGGEGKEVPMEHILGVDGEDELFAAAQYPCTADDHFEVRLIDAVEKNPCIFNR